MDTFFFEQPFDDRKMTPSSGSRKWRLAVNTYTIDVDLLRGKEHLNNIQVAIFKHIH